jgi:hypothetical protein
MFIFELLLMPCDLQPISGQDLLLHTNEGSLGGTISIKTGDTKFGDASSIKILSGKTTGPLDQESASSGKISIQTSPLPAFSGDSGSIDLQTGNVGILGSDMPGNITMTGGHFSLTGTKGGNVDIESGSASQGDAGDVSITSGLAQNGGGNINVFASTTQIDNRDWFSRRHTDMAPTEINFGFDEHATESKERKIALQLKKSKDSSRLTSTVPLQVTTIQYSSDSRIKKDIKNVNTDDLLERIRQIRLREYGYSEQWRHARGLENSDPRVRGVIAQELNEVFPEHIEILPELKMGNVNFEDFYQVDKQGLVMDCK